MIVVLAVCAAVVLKPTIGGDETLDEGEKEQKNLLFSNLSVSQLLKVKILSSKGTYIFERSRESPWEMRKPVQARVSQEAFIEAVEQLLSEEADSELAQEELSAPDASFGLKLPEAFITLEGESSSETLSIGNANPVTGKIYAQLQSSTSIYLLRAHFLEEMLKKFEQTREMRPLSFEASSVSAIAIIVGGKTPVRLSKKENAWRLFVDNQESPVRSDVIDQSLQKLSQLQADHVIDAPGPEMPLYGLGESATSVQLELEQPNIWGERTILIRIGLGLAIDAKASDSTKPREAYYISTASESAVYRTSEQWLESWRMPLSFFRAKALYPQGVEVQQASNFPADSSDSQAICLYLQDCASLSKVLSTIVVQEYISALPTSAQVQTAFTVLLKRAGELELHRYIVYRDNAEKYVLGVPYAPGEDVYAFIEKEDVEKLLKELRMKIGGSSEAGAASQTYQSHPSKK